MRAAAEWTVHDVFTHHPCPTYTRARIEGLFAGRRALSLRDVAALDIPPADRVWWFTREGVLTPPQRARWLARIVTRAVTRHALHCGIGQVETWARAWCDGSDRTAEAAWAAEAAASEAEAAAAEAAARAAAEAAASEAAAWAAAEAAWEAAAAWAAAEAAWEAAAAEAAEAAWEAAAWAAERDEQCADMLRVLDEEE